MPANGSATARAVGGDSPGPPIFFGDRGFVKQMSHSILTMPCRPSEGDAEYSGNRGRLSIFRPLIIANDHRQSLGGSPGTALGGN